MLVRMLFLLNRNFVSKPVQPRVTGTPQVISLQKSRVASWRDHAFQDVSLCNFLEAPRKQHGGQSVQKADLGAEVKLAMLS